MPTSTVWVGGLAPNITEDMLDRHFARYGRIKGLGLDRKRGYCMVSFEHIAGSTFAHNDLKERNLFGKRVRVCSAEAVCSLVSLYYETFSTISQRQKNPSVVKKLCGFLQIFLPIL
jgi:RNA recognition motif-containing protein